MKTFIYVVENRPNDRNGNPRGRIRVYRIERNKPRGIGTELIGFRSDAQAAIEIAIAAGELPKTVTERSAPGLRYAGIADFIGV